jgi:hypothetical protein
MAELAPRSGQVKNASGRGETMKLFMFYVGGDCGNSNIELHDVRFSAGD